MGLADLCYRCPECGHDPMAGKGDRAWCATCGFRVQRARGRLVATSPGAEPRSVEAVMLAEAGVLDKETGDAVRNPNAGASSAPSRYSGDFRHSAKAMVCWRVREEPVWLGGELRGWSETMGPATLATVAVDREAVAIRPTGASSEAASNGEDPDSRSGRSNRPSRPARSGRWSHLELRAVQTSSSSLQISLPGDQLVQMRFTTDSPKRWEDMLRQLVREAYRRAGRGFVHEFQPRISTR